MLLLHHGISEARRHHARKPSARDVAELKNYKPVSNLMLVSKVSERIVTEPLTKYLQKMIFHDCSQHTGVTVLQKLRFCVCYLLPLLIASN